MANNWRNFLIKTKHLKQTSLDEAINPFKVLNSKNGVQRFRSMSAQSKKEKESGLDSSKAKDKKKTFDLVKAIFKNNKGKKKKLIKKIDEFADEKVSHMMNLKKLKRKDPLSESLEAPQIRSISRTFTGKINSLQTGHLYRFGEALNANSLMGMSLMSSPKNDSKINTTNIEEEESKNEEIFLDHSMSRIGDFYDTPIIGDRSSIYIKHQRKATDFILPKTPKAIETSYKKSMDMSSKIIEEDHHALSGENEVIPEFNSSQSAQEEENESGETAVQQEKRIRKQSIFGHLKTWKLLRLIVKSGDDLRQEQFAMQLISQIDQIFKKKKLNIWLKPYEILATGKDCGLIEFLADAVSIDAFKKKNPNQPLERYFKQRFTKRSKLKKARDAFARSLAGYSLV